MINLLSIKAKQETYARYRGRRSAVFLAFLCILLLASILVFASMYTLLQTNAKTLTGNRDALKGRLGSSKYAVIAREAKDLRSKVDIILNASDEEFSAIWRIRTAIDRTLGEGVTLTTLQFVRAKEGAGEAGKLSLTAHVSDRKHMLQWEDRLKSEPMFSGVSIPTASLIKNEGSDVTLSFSVASGKKNSRP